MLKLNKNMKKWFIWSIVAVSIASLFFIITPGKSRVKSYYSGDAIAYQGKVYIATTNTGSLEIFKLDDNKLELWANTKPLNARFGTYGEFYDSKLSEENGRLYVYAVSNYTLYKYEISNRNLSLIQENTNTYWEWYNRVDKFGDDIVTISAKGVKIFNTNLETIVAYDFRNEEAPYNITGDNPNFFLSINESTSKLEIYNRESRSIIQTIPLNFKYSKGNRRAYQAVSDNIYVADDYYVKKFSMTGELLGSFQHLDFQGFDVSMTGHTDNLYFSNGVGVVKLDKDMDLLDYAWTGNLGSPSGWAMGLKAVYNQGDKVVVFNNTNILVLDENLNKIASVSASEEADLYPLENLYLRLDKISAAPNSSVLLAGGGFLPQEQLEINFGTVKTLITSDSNGRFSSILTVPSLQKGGHDIKVIGQQSKLHYSISFRVE